MQFYKFQQNQTTDEKIETSINSKNKKSLK